MVKLDQDRLAAEAATLSSLLATMPENDYLGRLGLEARRDEVTGQLAILAHAEEHRAKVALYFGGEPVIGSQGVLAAFGTKAVGSFQDLISKVWGTSDGDQLATTGPVPNKAASQLHLTTLLHGSFGFLLEELNEHGEPMFESLLSKAANLAVEYISIFADEDESRVSGVVEELNPRVFQSLREFFELVYRGNATVRIIEGARDARFDRAAVERGWHRAETLSVNEDSVHLQGRLLGIVPMRGRFEFEPDGSAKIIEGNVGEKFGQSYLERIGSEQFAGRRWNALFQKRVVTKAGRQPAEKYTLMELEAIGDH